MKNFKWLLALVMGLSLQACGRQDTVAFDNHNETSAVRAWNTASFPLTIHIPQEFDSYSVAIENAGQTWNQALNTQVFNFIYDDTPNTQWTNTNDSLKDVLFGFYNITQTWTRLNLGAQVLAATSTMTNGNVIRHGDILFNFQNHRFADAEHPPLTGNYVDFESVVVHELGHFLGLGHITDGSDPASIMVPNLSQSLPGYNVDGTSKGVKKRNLSELDTVRIKVLYGQY